MSAKPGRKSNHEAAPPPAPASVTGSGETSAERTAWIDSPDPRRRMLGKAVLAGVWIYVAALWLLALDQTLNLGIFGPQVPPVP